MPQDKIVHDNQRMHRCPMRIAIFTLALLYRLPAATNEQCNELLKKALEARNPDTEDDDGAHHFDERKAVFAEQGSHGCSCGLM